MKKLKNYLIFAVLGFSSGFGLLSPIIANAATTPSLGLATSYAVLGTTYTNTAAGTTINGDIGFTTPPAVVPAGAHLNYGSGAPYATAGINQSSALGSLASQACTFTFAPGAIDLAADTTHGPIGVYTPGVYCTGAASAASIGTAGITLSGSGTYIFRITGALTTVANSHVNLVGASVCDVFWTPIGATTLGANSTFAGTDIDAAGITIGSNVTWTGRALAFGETVTTGVNDTITAPVCISAPAPAPTPATLHIIKRVVNTSGTSTSASSFNLHVKLSGTDVSGSPASGLATPGRSYTLAANTYVVSEDANPFYTQSFSGDCNSSGSVTLAAGAIKTCTITNTEISAAMATLRVIKLVVNSNGGTSIPSNFTIHVKNGGTDVSGSPASGLAAPGRSYTLAANTYVVSEDANPFYTQSFSGDCNSSGSVTLAAGANKTCTIVNTDIPVPSGGGGGGGGGSISVPRIVPLINVLKIPSPLSLPNGSGLVTYDYTVSNVGGQQALVDVSIKDDKCSPLVFLTGDLNSNNKLDTNEKWKYRCTSNLSKTTTNTAIATGYGDDSYHQAAIATAIATVAVGTALTPPLINIVKIPNRLTPFSYGGGEVTYAYTVTNPGIVAMHDILVTDDKCSPVSFLSGDLNNDSLLNSSETWLYSCKTMIKTSTRNIATAKGQANGFTAIDYAFANVFVSPAPADVPAPVPPKTPSPSPHFPNTGFPPEEKNYPWNIFLLASIFAPTLVLLVRIAKKRKI